MLLTLLICIYISLLCWAWGSILIRGLCRLAASEESTGFHFSITCLAGLAGITIMGSIISLFAPLGGWYIQVILLVPALLFMLINFSVKTEKLKNVFRGFHFSASMLLLASFLMILIIGSWKIIHPDTLGYHMQTIKWIEEYKAVPGLVNLHPRYGYQGLWFVSCALFGFRYLGTGSAVFVNIAVLSWFFLFVIDKINKSCISSGSELKQILLWPLLFILSIWSYTQVRLTAASASPDFIATLLIWTVIYLAGKKKIHNAADWLLILLFCFFAVTVKLSAAPVLLIAGAGFIYFLKRKKYNLIFRAFVLLLIMAGPYVARNIITSGYIIFPSPFPDIAHADWKYDPASTALEKNYIMAYAKLPVEHTENEINEVLQMGIFEWLPYWWKNKAVADKAILLLMLFGFFVSIFNIRKIVREGASFALVYFVSLTGVLFWFIQAPDPRFGFGFIIPLAALSLYHFFSSKNTIRLKQKFIVVLLWLLSLPVLGYSAYRLVHFFSPRQLIFSMGVQQTAYTIAECNGIKYSIPQKGEDCGNLPLPCIYEHCESILPRGNKLSDGFRAK